jgi:tight adherence protein C
MMDMSLASLLQQAGLSWQILGVAGVGLGAMMVFVGLSGALAGKDPVLRRMAAQGRRSSATADRGILRYASEDPKGLMRTLIPANRKSRSQVERQLALAGYIGRDSVRNYYLLRLALGLGLPGVLLLAAWMTRTMLIPLPGALDTWLGGLGRFQLFQVLAFLVAAGFFGPTAWIRSRAARRRRAIEESFPNALDLIQISVEAGLGFDAAMIRVGNELESTAPELSQELLAAQREIQAGRTRERALLDMAARTGVDEVSAFANVVLQSIQFGTSVSDTLVAYACEMRANRELRAQEKANKLPVQMSAVMASLMLPALLMLTLGPVVIRYIRYFAQ